MKPSDWKYEFIRRRTYDNYVDRTGKRLDKIWDRVKNLDLHLSYAMEAIETLEAEVEGLKSYTDDRIVSLAGRREAMTRQD